MSLRRVDGTVLLDIPIIGQNGFHLMTVGGNFCEDSISTEIAMKTLFDFWRLLFWQDKIDRKNKRKEHLKKEKASLKTLSIMIEKDADGIRKKLEEEE